MMGPYILVLLRKRHDLPQYFTFEFSSVEISMEESKVVYGRGNKRRGRYLLPCFSPMVVMFLLPGVRFTSGSKTCFRE